MDPELRSKRALQRRAEGRRRLLAAVVLGLLANLILAPLILLTIPDTAPPPEPQVALVQIPAGSWDQNRVSNGEQPPPPRAARAPLPAAPPPPPQPPPPPPGQVVETAPGNQQRPPDSHLAAESDNTVQKQTIARDRQAGEKVTAPRRTTPVPPSESQKPPSPADGVAVTDPQQQPPQKVVPKMGTKAELPTTQRRDRLALQEDPHGGMAQQDASEAHRGNSDRLRLQAGEGEGDAPGPTVSGQPGTQNRLNLNPSPQVLDRIAGGPAPDMVEGVEKGDATFLNTREWKFASFFNRVKQDVAAQWKPNDVIRRRDPSGAMFLWKDRYTLLGVKLREDGRLSDVWVEKSSGVDFLDEEAIAAFQKAQPFPNPPAALVDGRGEIQFAFGFFLETDSGGLQIFRWR